MCSTDWPIALRQLTRDLLIALAALPVSRLLPSTLGGVDITDDIMKLRFLVSSSDFNLDRIRPLLQAALKVNADDALIWGEVRNAVFIVVTPSPTTSFSRSSCPETPVRYSMGRGFNSSESTDSVLDKELGHMYVGIPDFHERFFGEVDDLKPASNAFYEKCTKGSSPLFSKAGEGWRGWPKDANQKQVVSWLEAFFVELIAFAKDYKPNRTPQRILLAEPNKSILGSKGKRKMDIGFVDQAGGESECHWKQVLVPGELKSNKSADRRSEAWLDLARYVREVFAAQDSRRFVLGFTLCGSLLRIWEFDRLGGIASDQVDINKEGEWFVSVVLGFLWMNEEELGFDPTITRHGEQRFITINQNSQKERLVIGELMTRAACIVGRATTCWKVYRETDKDRLCPLVVKDSWQYCEREVEGEMLEKAGQHGVTNVAQCYHHETVHFGEKPDEITQNIRARLDITKAKQSRAGQSILSPSMNSVDATRKGSDSSASGQKRSASHDDASLRASKRPRSASDNNRRGRREHRRVVLSDYGKAIYKASSRSALLAGMIGCIKGHKSLREAGFLHRDISINNLIINEDGDNLTSFLIDLDLAITDPRVTTSRAKGRTGTKAFMAIGVLRGDPHTFMHDLESFFWVLFWICTHHNEPSKNPKDHTLYDGWNYHAVEDLADLKYAAVSSHSTFSRHTARFTEYYKPLATWMESLRQVVFPNGQPWETVDEELYSRMTGLLDHARLAAMGLEKESNTQA